MLVKLRDKEGRLCAKDILDIDFDMRVAETTTGKYVIVINQQYRFDGTYENKDEAEAEAYGLIEERNNLEEELRQ